MRRWSFYKPKEAFPRMDPLWPRNVVDEVHFSLDDFEEFEDGSVSRGGTHGEFSIEFYHFFGKDEWHPRVGCFADGFNAFFVEGFAAMLAELIKTKGESFSPDELMELAVERLDAEDRTAELRGRMA